MKITNQDLQAELNDALARHKVPGASVAVLSNGELTKAAGGVLNVNTGVEFTTDTVTHIGSITKAFTTTLIMQLVDEGRLDLDEKVRHYLPALRLKDPEALEQITVKMLLNHTSGVDGAMLPDHGHDEETIECGIARFAQLGQVHRPGSEFSYCNAGTVIAGYLAQQLTGQSWYRLIRERIFEPLRMKHAVTLPEEALLYRASVGHYLDSVSQNLVRTSSAFLPLSFSPCGTSLMTSAADLIAFASAHMTNGLGPDGIRILSDKSAQAMRQVTVNNNGKGYTYIDMGLGWMVTQEGLLHHLGGSPGIRSALYAYPNFGFAAAILTNADHGLSLINELVAPWLKEFGSTRPCGTADIRLPQKPVRVNADNYVGIYEDIVNRYIVSGASAGLTLSRQAKYAHYQNMSTEVSPPVPLIPLAEAGSFLEESAPGQNDGLDAFRLITFRNPGPDGRARHLGNFQHLYPRVS